MIRSPGFEDAEVGGHVGLGARVRLDVDVLGAGEEGEGALLGEPLGDVDELAAAVVALAGQAFGVLVGQPRALGFHDRGGGVVLAGDQLDLVVLAAPFGEHRLPEDRVVIRDRLERKARSGARSSWSGRLLPSAPGHSLARPARPERYLPTNGTATEPPR